MHFEQKTMCNKLTVLDKDEFWMKHLEHFNSTEVFKKSIPTTKTTVFQSFLTPLPPCPGFAKDQTSGQFLLAIPFLKPTELRSRVWSPVVCLLEWKLAQFFKLNDPHLARLTSWKQYEKGFTLKEQNGEIRDIGNGLDTN